MKQAKYTIRVFLGFIRKCRHVTHSKKYRRCCRHYFQLTERNGKKVICICGGFLTVFQPEFHFSSERRKISERNEETAKTNRLLPSPLVSHESSCSIPRFHRYHILHRTSTTSSLLESLPAVYPTPTTSFLVCQRDRMWGKGRGASKDVHLDLLQFFHKKEPACLLSMACFGGTQEMTEDLIRDFLSI